MAVRIMAVFVLAAAGAAMGKMLSSRGVKRADALGIIMEDLKSFREYTLIRLMPASDALLKMKAEVFRRMGELMRESKELSLSQAFREASADEEKDDAKERCLVALFVNIEALSKKEHEAEYEKCLSALSETEKALRLESREKAKLHASLGALIGLSSGIFLM